MKMRTLAAAVAMTAGFVAAAHAEPATYAVDPSHTSVTSQSRHFGTSTTLVKFLAKSGTITIDPAAGTGKADIVIDAASPLSGIPKLDEHLKSTEFFSAKLFPEATFTATGFKFNGDKVTQITGELTMVGKTNPIVLNATNYSCYTSPMSKKQVCGGDFETTVQRSQWNINYLVPLVSDETKLVVQIEAIKQ